MFMIVGAVDKSESVSQMIEIRNQIIECKSVRRINRVDPVPILFVINKTDLPSSKWEIDFDEVSYER
ncbi:unnamed protein product [Enterobius vermicularis]|uniref:G domain-containing protein n=1 Tax=Enterobius vermicularis TaxID=51028 RepID=A0A0N4VER1_ENTVE|nr:unnamed protein product [Enterobius vermicularis]